MPVVHPKADHLEIENSIKFFELRRCFFMFSNDIVYFGKAMMVSLLASFYGS